ncbi:MAG: AI-2E family transporter [Pseudomonadota bacterium]|nr:AI-2E family transporter [Pseudomonadota bacterium]
MSLPPSRIDQTLQLAVLAMLIIGCYFVLQPFLTALVWAAILCTTTWPLYLRMHANLGGRDALAALAMVLLLSLLMLAPFIVVGATIADNAARMATWGRQILEAGPPEAPAWIARLPLIGERVADYWNSTAHDTAQLLSVLSQYLEPLRKFAVASGASVVGAVLQLALSIFIAWFMFRDGHAIVERMEAIAQRIAGDRGVHLASVATVTVRSVVLGVLGTALVQGVVAGIGFWIAGIGAATLLGLLTFVMSPVPIGPPLVWVPAGLWLINDGQTGWGIFVLLWGVFAVSTIDNVIKPLIISRRNVLPFMFVLLGVLGGAAAFGFIGVFIGPVLLAVGYALLMEWAESRTKVDIAAPSGDDDRARSEWKRPRE